MLLCVELLAGSRSVGRSVARSVARPSHCLDRALQRPTAALAATSAAKPTVYGRYVITAALLPRLPAEEDDDDDDAP